MSDESRETIARRQTAFLDRLGGSAPPGGFDAIRVRTAGDALSRKRARSVAKSWPRMTNELGDRFAQTFAAYAREHPWPPAGGPSADGWLLATWLERERMLGDEGTIELAACRLRARWNVRGQRLDRRTRFSVQAVRLPRSPVVVVAMRVLGWEWWRRLPSGPVRAGAPALDARTLTSDGLR